MTFDSNGDTGHAAASETTPLVAADASSNGNGDVAAVDQQSDAGSEETVQSERLWEELEKPWPSTYERSIALLSSPIIKATEVDLFTKSPKPGSTPLALTRRRDLRRGFYTPERTRVLPPDRLKSFEHGDRGSDAFSKVQTPVEKVKSLDFKNKKEQFLQFQKQQEQKALAAKKYREEILKKADAEQGLMSPGYAREKRAQKAARAAASEAEAMLMHDGKSTVSQCVFNLANILMGVGLLALPFALKSAGWIGGLFSLSVFGLITWRTSILIGRELNGDPRPAHVFVDSPFKSPLQPGSVPEARMYPPISSFPDIARASFGETGCVILSVILYFELFSCICIFLVTIGDHLHQLFTATESSTFIVIVGVISIFPAVVLRTPALLSYLSMIGTCATIAVVLSVVASAVHEGDISTEVAKQYSLEDRAPYHQLWDTSGIALAFGLVAYCFSGHAIVPSIYTSMKEPQKYETMVTYTYLIVMGACMGVAAAGYYMFGATVLDQVTLSLERSSKAATAMKILTWLMVLTAFSKVTLTMFPLSLGMEEILAPYLTSERYVQFSSIMIKLVITALALYVAVCVPSFSFICALVGMICTMTVSVIFPAAAHLKLFWPRLNWFDKLLDFTFIAIGSVMAVVGTIITCE